MNCDFIKKECKVHDDERNVYICDESRKTGEDNGRETEEKKEIKLGLPTK